MTDDETDRDRRADAALGEIDPLDEEGDPSYALAAAAIATAHLNTDAKLPPHLSARVVADAEAFFARAKASPTSTTAAGAQVIVMPAAPAASPRIDYARWGGWIAAAACIVIVVTQALGLRASRSAAVEPRVTDRISLHPPDGAPSIESADFAWDALAHRGAIHARGLAPNALGEEYEAWIDDRTVDGDTLVPIGHFVVPGADPGAIVDAAVQSPIALKAPARIVITVERAGGVLVSPRSKVVLAGAFGKP